MLRKRSRSIFKVGGNVWSICNDPHEIVTVFGQRHTSSSYGFVMMTMMMMMMMILWLLLLFKKQMMTWIVIIIIMTDISRMNFHDSTKFHLRRTKISQMIIHVLEGKFNPRNQDRSIFRHFHKHHQQMSLQMYIECMRR
jgi:hypothetical protein